MAEPLELELCLRPKCGQPAVAGGFCATCVTAPKTRRAGWASAAARKRAVSSHSSDVNAVAPWLWIGSKPPIDRDLPHVDVLVLCAKEYQPPALMFHGTVIRCPLDDGPPPTRDEVNRALLASKAVAAALSSKKRVLSTCQMGLNRSAFVAALALGRLTYASADELVAQMRARRDPRCLSNPHFLELLRKFVGDGRRERNRIVRAPAT